MAEERNLATARAPELTRDEAEPTKEELQRRMEEARDSISQTVSDIKDTVTTQYENVRESISQTLDWREQYRRRPVAFSVGALGVGLVLGYSVGGVFGGEGGDDLAGRYYEAEGDYDEGAQQRSYAAQAITGGAYGSTAYAATPPSQASAETAAQAFDRGMARQGSQPDAAPRPSYSSGYDTSAAAEAEEESNKPSVLARFKETKAYDRLQDELGSLGERAVEELSKTARNVVLPALLGKLKDMIGIDLSTQREVAQRSRLEKESATAQKQTDGGTGEAATAPGGTAYGSGTGGYGKSL
jgi:ElaB/YqjD/DUF883 family membrane-anchored ribosome-binding protein